MTDIEEAMENFAKKPITDRVMTLKEYKSKEAHLGAYEVFVTTNIPPKIRRALFRLMELRPGSVVGDVGSMKRHVPLVVELVFRVDEEGNRLQGRPRKVHVERV